MLDLIKNFFGETTREEELEPKKYKLEVSGWPEGVGQGIVEYISSTAQKGATYIEITADHPNSFTPHDIREIKTFHKQENVKINLHATMQLRTVKADRKDYKRVEDYLEGYIDVADELGCDYLNFHTSAFPSPELARITGEARGEMVSPEGKTAEEFIIEAAKNKKTFKLIYNELKDTHVSYAIERKRHDLIIKKFMEEESEEVEEKERKKMPETVREKAVTRYRGMSDEERHEIGKELLAEDFKDLDELPFDTTSRGIDELSMYRMVAWKMYGENDGLWNKICGDRDPTKVENDGDIDLLVDAVAGKYLQKHIEHLQDKLEKTDVVLTLETPDARDKEYIGYYRLVKPSRFYHVIKKIGHPQVKICIDFEHIATHGLDPKEELEDAPKDLGKQVYVVHISGNPGPGHEHAPIKKGEKNLYEMLWILRRGGFKSGYLNFERGSGEEEEIWQESIPRAKEMAMFLEDEVKPKDLPAEFYGYTDWEFKHDKAVIDTHMFDPIRGLIESPELQDTFLGRHATEEGRMRREDWEREEHR